MRCPRCGNENPGMNRFCGMCGATMLPATTPVTATQPAGPPALTSPSYSPLPAPAAMGVPPSATGSQRAARPAEPEPMISGPSFLGLNQPAVKPPPATPPTASAGRASLSIDPNSAPASRNLDYLLDDDEPQRGGAGKYILIVVALLLAVGLGYLRWKNQGFGWLTTGTKKPAATQPSDTADSTTPTTPSDGTSSSPTPAPSGTGTVPQPAQDPASSTANPSTNPAASATPATGDATGAGNAPSSLATPADKAQPSGAKDSGSDPNKDPNSDPNVAPMKPVKPKPAATDTTAKPTPSTQPARATDTVSEAQKYLYGKGVRQDCDRGLRMLKPAADRANPKAMVEMGALYSAGLCTPRDLPTAYRWFAMALRKEPDNQSVQADLQKLWGEMTQPERQLAIKMSQ